MHDTEECLYNNWQESTKGVYLSARIFISKYQCWARATFFSSRHHDMCHFLKLCTTAPPRHRTTAPPHHRATALPHHRTTAPLFQQNLSRHRISATTPPRHLILASPLHIVGGNSRYKKIASLSRIYSFIT